ncbi:LysR family transcriptional regulator [Alcaligenes sp. Marseille-Q7550]
MQSLAFKYFYEVAQTGSLSAASESLHVAISAISRQISALEQRLGTPLFERSARGMRLTEAGQLLLRHVRRSLLETEAAFEQIAALRGAERSPIRIACTQGLANELVPGAIAAFGRKHPRCRFRIWVDSARGATERVAAGEADMAVTFSTTPADHVQVRYAHSAAALAVMSQTHPLAERRRLSLKDLVDYPLALTDENTSTYRLFQLASNMAGLNLQPRVFSNYAEALHAYVRDSQAVLFASYVSISERLRPNRLVAIPLRNTEMHARTIQVQVMSGRILPDMMEQFIEFMIRRVHEVSEAAPR